MRSSFQWLATVALGCLACMAAPADANTVGNPVSVDQNARITRGGTAQVLRVGVDVAMGDVIETDGRGKVQLVFQDNTRIAIGPNSRLVIERVLFRRSGKAESFVVGTTRGAFRFLSGDSPRSAYSVRTPTTTLGIRGTIFDVTVGTARGTDVVLLSGEVRLCAGGGTNCAILRGECSTANSTASAITAPQSRGELRTIVRENFPFVVSQVGLREDFIAPVIACGGEGSTQVPVETRERRSDGGGASTDAP